jgi:hypothetical protein
MNLFPLPLHWKKDLRWDETLRACGFHSTAAGYQNRDSIHVQSDCGWLVMTACTRVNPGDSPGENLPGLWKPVDTGRGPRSVFEIPLGLLIHHEEEPDESASPLLQATLQWALATFKGRLPDGWEPPSRETLDALLPESGLTVQVGSHLRQGELMVSPERLALQFPLIFFVPGELSATRRAWLNEWMNQAQRLWRLVRFRMTRRNQETGCYSEVNLSGVPPALAWNLTLTGLECLQWAVSGLVETAQYLADASLSSEALDPPNCSKLEPLTNNP